MQASGEQSIAYFHWPNGFGSVWINSFFQEESFLYASIIRVSAILMFFLQGCAGFVMMVRQEFQQGIVIRGCAAQVMGFIFGLIGWFLAFYLLAYTLSLSIQMG